MRKTRVNAELYDEKANVYYYRFGGGISKSLL